MLRKYRMDSRLTCIMICPYTTTRHPVPAITF